MSDIAIQVEHLSKSYRIGTQKSGSLRESLADKWRWVTGGHQAATSEEFWALDDVSFEIKRGEAVGIIGKNGAGKSTLLKILSRITEPTKGRIEINGRVASLLEVGTGFHPELSGRENIYLNGTILGMTRREIRAKFDEIVAFSGVEKFIDTPVKFYSSGMYVRLAFAVAAHLEPEILIIDEVLAVGDAEFQKKCLGKMGEVTGQGRTVLFVSHNMTAVSALCSTALLMSKGSLSFSGNTQETIIKYLSAIRSRECLRQEWEDVNTSPGNNLVRVKRIEVKAENSNGLITIESSLKVIFEFWNRFLAYKVNLSMHLYAISGELVFATVSNQIDVDYGVVEFECIIPKYILNDGVYYISMMIVSNAKPIFLLEEGVTFEVHDTIRIEDWHGKWPGLIRPRFEWNHSFSPLKETVNQT